MNKLFLILLLFTCLRAAAQRETEIAGTISDEKGVPLHGATVFLSNTKYATPTNSKGRFNLTGIPQHSYEIVVKMVGFEPYIEKVYAGEEPVHLTIILKESNTVLNDVTISGEGKDQSRDRYLKLFTQYFIGESSSAYCKILNPQQLVFNYDKKTDVLEASTDDMLQIENDDLGYKLNYLFLNFKIDPNIGGMSYRGYAYFEELKGTQSQQNRWEMHRKAAHIDSIEQFFKVSFKNSPAADYFLQKNSKVIQ